MTQAQTILRGRAWNFCPTPDLETLWKNLGQEDFSGDERLPYWTEIWPAAVSLSTWLMDHPEKVASRTGLELGCGQGLIAMVAAFLGAGIIGLDYEWPAVLAARKNSLLNRHSGKPPFFVQMDWRNPAVLPRSLDFILAGDIFYERRFVEPIAAFIAHALKPEAKAWLAGPDRNTCNFFAEAVERFGWSCRLIQTETVPPGPRRTAGVVIHIWELYKGEFDGTDRHPGGKA